MLSAHHLVSDELFVGVGCVACCLMWCVMEFPVIWGPAQPQRGPAKTQFGVLGCSGLRSASRPDYSRFRCPARVTEAKGLQECISLLHGGRGISADEGAIPCMWTEHFAAPKLHLGGLGSALSCSLS